MGNKLPKIRRPGSSKNDHEHKDSQNNKENEDTLQHPQAASSDNSPQVSSDTASVKAPVRHQPVRIMWSSI